MTDYGTVKLPREDYERHNDRRQSMGLTWAEYVDGESPAGGVDEHALAQEVTDLVAGGEIRIDPNAIADAVAERVGGGDTVDARIVDMDASERKKFAEEVAGVLQR